MTKQPPEGLEPCPFCGSDEKSHGWISDGCDEQGVVQTHADGCGAAMIAEWEDQAITRWNTRAPSPASIETDGPQQLFHDESGQFTVNDPKTRGGR